MWSGREANWTQTLQLAHMYSNGSPQNCACTVSSTEALILLQNLFIVVFIKHTTFAFPISEVLGVGQDLSQFSTLRNICQNYLPSSFLSSFQHLSYIILVVLKCFLLSLDFRQLTHLFFKTANKILGQGGMTREVGEPFPLMFFSLVRKRDVPE